MASIKVGTRVYVDAEIERFPHFIAPRGLGTVVAVEPAQPEAMLFVVYDEHIPGAEEWQNEIQLSVEDLPFVHVVPEPAHPWLQRVGRLLAGLVGVWVFVARRDVCGHSACSQHFIDTGDRSCLKSREVTLG